MGQELRRLDLRHSVFHQLAEFAPLLFADRAAQVLNFRQALRTKTTKATSGSPVSQE